MLAHPRNSPSAFGMMNVAGGPDAPRRRKRKAESQDNERLSKRMSLLNIEKGGTRLYVPVENPHNAPPIQNHRLPNTDSNAPHVYSTPISHDGAPHATYQQYPPPITADDMMQLDDSKHKVYIYNLDDELSSSDSESDPSESGRLLFIPDIEKHLVANRIPPGVLPNGHGELAGMQLVLYREPASLTVSEDCDSVRRVVVEARERLREKQRLQKEGRWVEQQRQRCVDGRSCGEPEPEAPTAVDDPDAMDLS